MVQMKSSAKKQKKNAKQIFNDFMPTVAQSSFEFPRQQESSFMNPEVMQFKASQQLLNPSGESPAASNLQTIGELLNCITTFNLTFLVFYVTITLVSLKLILCSRHKKRASRNELTPKTSSRRMRGSSQTTNTPLPLQKHEQQQQQLLQISPAGSTLPKHGKSAETETAAKKGKTQKIETKKKDHQQQQQTTTEQETSKDYDKVLPPVQRQPGKPRDEKELKRKAKFTFLTHLFRKQAEKKKKDEDKRKKNEEAQAAAAQMKTQSQDVTTAGTQQSDKESKPSKRSKRSKKSIKTDRTFCCRTMDRNSDTANTTQQTTQLQTGRMSDKEKKSGR